MSKLTSSPTAPGAPVTHERWLDTLNHTEKRWDGVHWIGVESPATLVVAASDSMNKGTADIICGGTADEVQINAALTAAAGGEVLLLEGSYEINGNITVPASTTFAGVGKGVILTSTAAVGITNMVVINGDHVTIKDMRLALGAGAGTATTRPNVIYSDGPHYLLLENLYIEGDESVADDGFDQRQCGICLLDTTFTKIINCYVIGCDRHGIYGQFWTSCEAINNDSGWNTGCGMFLSSCSDGVISGNVFVDNGGGTYSSLYVFLSDDNVISNNHSRSPGNHGIEILRSNDNVITGNYCNTSQVDGINVTGNATSNADYNVITGNVCITSSTGAGIKIVGGTDCNYNVVKANTCRGNSTFPIDDAGNGTIFDQVIHSVASLDLSGVASDLDTFFASCPCQLVGYSLQYTELSSVNAGVNVHIGRYQDGVALDVDYFDVSASEASKNLGYSKAFVTADLTQKLIAIGDSLTVGTVGGKVGTGEVKVILKIAEGMS